MKKKRWWILPAAVLLLFVAAFLIYAGNYYRATDAALQALESDDVLIEQTEYGWFFDGPAADRALVFYPGANVEDTAYAPLLHRLAGSGVDVCLVKMPLHMAVFGANSADRILAQYDYAHWYIGGHSLGGAVAANYAAVHDLDGVILFASYPTKDVDESMLILYGSEDGVLNRQVFSWLLEPGEAFQTPEAVLVWSDRGLNGMSQIFHRLYRTRLARADQFGAVDEVVIDGGNHAGFGEYGAQAGDHEAEISSAEQQQTAADAIAAWLSTDAPQAG